MSQLSKISVILCDDCGINTYFIGGMYCDDGKNRCLGCWEAWAFKRGAILDFEHCDECSFPLVGWVQVHICDDYSIVCDHCYYKGRGREAS